MVWVIIGVWVRVRVSVRVRAGLVRCYDESNIMVRVMVRSVLML